MSSAGWNIEQRLKIKCALDGGVRGDVGEVSENHTPGGTKGVDLEYFLTADKRGTFVCTIQTLTAQPKVTTLDAENLGTSTASWTPPGACGSHGTGSGCLFVNTAHPDEYALGSGGSR